ncbi:MAG: C40 family peptidase [Alphaproteobacteria bacterium]|jgi:cell wall-associated NlpC family hydrolase|nr:C40 family peptidase [Alphaproteobacteria bacterium]
MIQSLNHKSFIILLLLLVLAGCSSASQKRNAVVQTALKEVGTPYKSGGYKHTTGFDCSGLVYHAYKTNGYQIPRTTEKQYEYGSKVWLARKPGDLLFFNTAWHWWSIPSWFRVNHVGIYIGDGKMVHAPSSGGKVHVVNNVFNNPYWQDRYKKTKRII